MDVLLSTDIIDECFGPIVSVYFYLFYFLYYI